MMRLRSLLFALFGLLYVASWPGVPLRPVMFELAAAPVPENVGDRDGVLDVMVRAADGSKEPLGGARVRAFAMLDGRAHDAGNALTDRTGRATLKNLPHAEHWIVADARGRARASQMVVVVSGARRLDLELAAEHTLEVRVKDERGDPLVGAELEVRGPDPFPVGARTDQAGAATISRLGAGPYVVTARSPGYEEVTRRRVNEGDTCVLTLSKQGALLVHVVGENGESVPSARVLVASPSLWPARVAETGKDGTVRIGGLETGAYAIRSVHNTLVSPIEIGISVARGEEKPVELRLAPGIMISAHVVDGSNDDDIPRARLTLTEGGLSPFPIEATTDKNGHASLGPIARGEASLAVRADGFVAKPAVRIDDPPPAEVKVSLVAGGTLIGKVVDTRGYVVDGATVRVVGTDVEGMPIDEDPERASFRDAHFTATLGGPSPLVSAGELGVMPGPVPPIPHDPSALGALAPGPSGEPKTPVEPWVTGRDGMFEAKSIPPGRVRAIVRHPQYVEAMSDVVAITSNGSARVDVVLSRGGTLEGKVVDTRGRAVAGAHVSALAAHGSLERLARTGTDGSFAFAALPQAVTLLVSRDEDVSVVAARAEVAIPEAGKKTVEITLPDARPALDVRVTDGRSGVETAQVSAVSLDASEGLRVTAFTDARGNASLASAKGLSLRVEVHAPGRAPKIVVTQPDAASLTIELSPAESVIGEVRFGRREAAPDAEVVLSTDSGTHRARTNKDGEFTIEGVAPGRARLRVRAKGRSPIMREVVIEERAGRRPTDLGRIELAEEGIVSGIVVDEKGNPIPGARVAKDAVATYVPVASTPLAGMVTCDARGRFTLSELAEGSTTLEAYAPDVGRARVNVKVVAGRTTEGVKIVLAKDAAPSQEPIAAGGVAVTLGETAPSVDEAPQVVIVAVVEGSEAERAGLLAYDIVVEVGGAAVKSIADARARLSGPLHDDAIVKVRRAQGLVTLRVAREAVRR